MNDNKHHCPLISCLCIYVCMYVYIVVVIEFWHGFVEYNYMSLNCQLIPLQLLKFLTSNDYNYTKMTNHIVKVLMNW